MLLIMGHHLCIKVIHFLSDLSLFTSFFPILRTCNEIQQIGVALCGKKSAYIKTDDEWIFDEIARHYPAHTRVTDFAAIDDDIFKITVCDRGIFSPQFLSVS